jgi:hypothetical protein
MKTIKLINLFILALFCQVVFAQNNDIIKSVDLRMNESVEKRLDSTKDKTSEKDDLGYVHERYAQF